MDLLPSKQSLGRASEARGYGLCLLLLFVFMSVAGAGRARGDVALLVEASVAGGLLEHRAYSFAFLRTSP
jgi:hypothetical protein